MEKSSRIVVAGHRGLVGSAIVRPLEAQGYRCILKATSNELDYTDHKQTARWFEANKPKYALLAAAKVGMRSLGWSARTSLQDGIRIAYDDFCNISKP